MAQFEFNITEANIGETIGPPDGYLVALSRTTAPVNDGPPRWSESQLKWLSGYFCLRSSGDVRDLICTRDASTFFWVGPEMHLVINSSISYRGALEVVCVPRGSTWSLTLSDVPNVRAPEPVGWRGVPFGDKPNTLSLPLPLLRQPVMVESRP